jgi:predicted nucleotidyltransferase
MTYQKDADQYLSNITGLENYSKNEILGIVRSWLKECLREFNIKVVNVHLTGSRITGTAKENDDLDVLLYYDGSYDESFVHNLLNEEKTRLFIENIPVDFKALIINENNVAS